MELDAKGILWMEICRQKVKHGSREKADIHGTAAFCEYFAHYEDAAKLYESIHEYHEAASCLDKAGMGYEKEALYIRAAIHYEESEDCRHEGLLIKPRFDFLSRKHK